MISVQDLLEYLSNLPPETKFVKYDETFDCYRERQVWAHEMEMVLVEYEGKLEWVQEEEIKDDPLFKILDRKNFVVIS